MSIVYRKTAKGLAEIETRAFGLSPRLRQALILFDGLRTEAELDKLILADPFVPLGALLADGFIEVARAAVDAPLQRTARVEDVKRDAARFLIDKLGPTAEGLAIKLERAKTIPEVQPLLDSAAQTLRGVNRDALADEFIARFVTPLQS
jgi:hypothetical protein